MAASNDVNTFEGGVQSSHTGLTPSVIPKAEIPLLGNSSKTGVSTNYTLSINAEKHEERHWYVVRTTYGREKKAYNFIIQHKGTAFLPTIYKERHVNGHKKIIEVSRIPNLFFVYGTEENVKFFVYDNVNLPYLRFYYKHTHSGTKIVKEPLVVPDNQIKSLMIICNKDNDADILLLQKEVEKFKKGEKVVVKEGNFKGVTGIVARYHGQQRVGLIINGLLTAITAYVPTAFLERI